MAPKLGFTKLKINHYEKMVDYFEINDVEVEVKQYLPIEDKLELITNVLNNAVDNKGFYNPARIEIFFTLEMISAYANINVTEKLREDVFRTYDRLVASGLYEKFKKALPESEFNQMWNWCMESIQSVYKYRNSVMGMLETMNNDYKELNLDAKEIKENLGDKENLTLVRDILDKLG
jgi:hypothetical protein